jgi:hypothetical protein
MFREIFKKVEPVLKDTYKKITRLPAPNYEGDRDIEHSFIAANIPEGRGAALDFGAGLTHMGFIAARKGFKVTALDRIAVPYLYEYPDLKFLQADFLDIIFNKDKFDLIINCSTIEHLGLVGRYGVKKYIENADIIAMRKLWDILKPDSPMLLTIPVGVDCVFMPQHRIYGCKRLPKLLNGWKVVKKEFWEKDDNNRWQLCDEERVLARKATQYYYSLGLFVLNKNI